MQKRQNLPIVCGTLVVINVIVYLICTFTGDFQLVARLPLYFFGRQPEGENPPICQSHHYHVPGRLVAWRFVEFCTLGNDAWRCACSP